MKRVPKVKIDQVDLNMFTYEDLIIDPYWDDLYNPKNIRNNRIKNKV
jgi:hypothetical protein